MSTLQFALADLGIIAGALLCIGVAFRFGANIIHLSYLLIILALICEGLGLLHGIPSLYWAGLIAAVPVLLGWGIYFGIQIRQNRPVRVYFPPIESRVEDATYTEESGETLKSKATEKSEEYANKWNSI